MESAVVLNLWLLQEVGSEKQLGEKPVEVGDPVGPCLQPELTGSLEIGDVLTEFSHEGLHLLA